MPDRWRVGSKVGRTLYLDGELAGLMDMPDLAAMVVEAMNARGATMAVPVEPKCSAWFDTPDHTGSMVARRCMLGRDHAGDHEDWAEIPVPAQEADRCVTVGATMMTVGGESLAQKAEEMRAFAREMLGEVAGFMAAEHREKCGGSSGLDDHGLSTCPYTVCRDYSRYLEAQRARLS
jgi:hypothetical protein